MAKANKWGEVLNSLSQTLEGNLKRTRKKKAEPIDPFDIFTPEFTSVYAKKADDKDRQINEQKDGYKTGVESYLAFKRSHKKRTPTTYNNNYKELEKQFSSPKEEQQTLLPTNTGEYEAEELQGGINYSDPVISTKPTPTSRKLGVARPGPSTFIQTAKYNPETKRLNIQYTDGTIFPYFDVSPELADKILKKKSYHSPGQTLLSTIFYGHGTTRADEINDIDEGM